MDDKCLAGFMTKPETDEKLIIRGTLWAAGIELAPLAPFILRRRQTTPALPE